MRTATFRAVGGYDPSFSHNEDAELDLRLTAAGGKIWLTSDVNLAYFPRDAPLALLRQYFSFGRGRCRTMFKHRVRPRLRQAVLLGVAPSVVLALATPVLPLAWVPAALWIGSGFAFGGTEMSRTGDRANLLAGPAALMMHSAWSAGFWLEAARQMKANTRISTAVSQPLRSPEQTPQASAGGLASTETERVIDLVDRTPATPRQ